MLSPLQRLALESFARLPDQEKFYFTGGAALAEFHLRHRSSRDLDFFTAEQGLIQFILQREKLDPLLEMAARKDPGFDLYWFVVALQRTQGFPDEPERWPVMMQVPFSPVELKRTFLDIAGTLMQRILPPRSGHPGQ